MPKSDDEMRFLLNAVQMEKAAYEVGCELNNRPNWPGANRWRPTATRYRIP
jgi:predicted trehalose synthase